MSRIDAYRVGYLDAVRDIESAFLEQSRKLNDTGSQSMIMGALSELVSRLAETVRSFHHPRSDAIAAASLRDALGDDDYGARIAEALTALDEWCKGGGEKLRHYRLANADTSVEMSAVEIYETDGTAAGEKLVEYSDEPTRLASLEAAAAWVREQGGGK